MPLHPAASNAPEEPAWSPEPTPAVPLPIHQEPEPTMSPPSAEEPPDEEPEYQVPADGASFRFPMPVKPSPPEPAASPRESPDSRARRPWPYCGNVDARHCTYSQRRLHPLLGAAGLVILILLAALWLLPLPKHR